MAATEFDDFFYASPDGLKLHARVYGAAIEGPTPAICLPGLTRNARDFHELAQYLSYEARTPRKVVAFDYRGRGQSEYDRDWRNYDALVEAGDIMTGLVALGIEHGAFIGTSRGGLSSTIARCNLPRYCSRFSSLAASRKTGLLPTTQNRKNGDKVAKRLDLFCTNLEFPPPPEPVHLRPRRVDEDRWRMVIRTVPGRAHEVAKWVRQWDPCVVKLGKGIAAASRRSPPATTKSISPGALWRRSTPRSWRFQPTSQTTRSASRAFMRSCMREAAIGDGCLTSAQARASFIPAFLQ
jgi:pimeloyl-ACP methyl ester carboxylesterase